MTHNDNIPKTYIGSQAKAEDKVAPVSFTKAIPVLPDTKPEEEAPEPAPVKKAKKEPVVEVEPEVAPLPVEPEPVKEEKTPEPDDSVPYLK
jgi:hypothetical protein